MKIILFTLFLNYELFFCKTVHKKILNHTFLTRNLHKSLKEIDTLLRGVQSEINKERKILRSQIDYENAPVPEDHHNPNYDVTDIFWGETGVEGLTNEDVTSTFLPTISTKTQTTEEAYPEEEIVTVPPTPTTQPPVGTPETRETPEAPLTSTRNTSFDNILITPPNFDAIIKDEEEDEVPPFYTMNDSDSPFTVPQNESLDLTVTPPNLGKLTRSLIHEFNKYFGFISQSYRPPDVYTLTPIVTTRQLSKYLVRNVQKPNLHLAVSGKEIDNFGNLYSHATTTTPVQRWTTESNWAGLTAMPHSKRPLSQLQLWSQQQQMKKSATPVHREGPLTPQSQGSPQLLTDQQLSAVAAEMAGPELETPSFEILGTDRDPLTSTSVSMAPPTGMVFEGIGIRTTTKVPSARQVYYKMMEEQNEGYLVIFLQQILRITSLKDEQLVKPVLEEVELNAATWFEHEWFGDPLTNVITDISRFISEGPIDIVRSYSSMLSNMLQVRKTAVSVDVNSIIDYADLLYNEDEGGGLFDAVIEYEAFPNGSKSAKEVCVAILDSFILPYRRLSRSERRQTLVDSVNYALKTRFPLRTRIFGDLLNIKPQTTTNKPKSQYITELHKRSKYKRKSMSKKKEEANDVIKYFSSRLDNIESLKTTTKFVGYITPIINKYMFKSHKRIANKIKNNNKDKKTTGKYENLIFDPYSGQQKERAIDLDRTTNKEDDFNDFDEYKEETEESDTYLLSNSKEIKEILKKAQDEGNFGLKEIQVKEDDEVSTNEIDAMKEKLQNMIVKAQPEEDYDKMEALKSYAHILNEDNQDNQRVPSKNSDSDVSLPISDTYS